MNTFIICLLGLYGIVMFMMCFLQYYTTYSNNKKSINQVHFYVVRDNDDLLWLYLGKPYRYVNGFNSCDNGCVIAIEDFFSRFG